MINRKKRSFKAIVIMTLIIISSLFYQVQADWIKPEDYRPSGIQSAQTAVNVGNKLIGVVQLIGSAVSVITLIILGIKYMLGSVEERAEYKKTMLPYVIGAVMVFSITNLLVILSNIVESVL